MIKQMTMKPTSQRTKNVSNPPTDSVKGRIQPAGLASMLHPFGHTQNIVCRDPVSAAEGGISCDKTLICLDFINYDSVKCNSTTNSVQYNGITKRFFGLERADVNEVTIPDGRGHAGPFRAKGHRRVLSQQFFDDGLMFGHKQTIPYLKGVGKT